MRTGMLRGALAGLSLVCAVTFALPASAAGPVRSGTIVASMGPVYESPGSCTSMPDCLAWKMSGCDPRLAEHNPAAFSSIVDVQSLAGTRRRLVIEFPYDQGWFGSTYEFWASDCSYVGRLPERSKTGTRFTVPISARWMTVTAGMFPYRWSLW